MDENFNSQLVTKIEEFYKSRSRRKDEAEMAIRELLWGRQRSLNADFQWTEKNIDRFKIINDRLLDACERGWEEAKSVAYDLERRIEANDSFIKDFEIDIRISAYPDFSGGSDLDEEMESYFGEEATTLISFNISHIHFENSLDEDNLPIHIDKEIN